MIHDFAQFLAELATPPGFNKRLYAEQTDGKATAEPRPACRFATKDDDIEIIIEFYTQAPPKGRDKFTLLGSGHVNFNTSKGRKTFDRTGVGHSFYVMGQHTVADIDSEIKVQLQKVEESRQRLDRSLTVPQLGYNVTPEVLDTYRSRLRKGQAITLTPAGFGTGHSISKSSSAFARKASVTLEKFFDVGPLYISELDCD